MINLEAFGHFFAFTATASFAATLYSELQPILFSIITTFKTEKLYEEKNICTENYKFFNDVYPEIENNLDDEESRNWEKKKFNLERKKIDMEEASSHVKHFIDDLSSDSYKDNFGKKIKPLFPLAGTYSVILLLLGAFSHAYHYQENLYLNILILTNICFCYLVYHNMRRFEKSVSINSRNIFLNTALLICTALATFISIIITTWDLYILAFPSWSGVLILLWTLILSGTASIGIAYKYVIVNRIAKQKLTTFSAINSEFDDLVKSLIKKIEEVKLQIKQK